MNIHFHGFVDDGVVYLDDAQADALRGAVVESDDVLLNITGASIGRVTTAPPAFAGARVNQHVCIIRTNQSLNPRFLASYLASPEMQRFIWTEQSGMTRQALTKGQILELNIPHPPLNEQRRIVAKIDALQARSRRAREALDAVPALLDRFRQSVLAAAFRGDLTADWRAKHPDVEPASVLLDRIRAERKVRWVEAEAEKARASAEATARKAGKSWGPPDDAKVVAVARKKAEGKYTEPEPVDAEAEGLPELPDRWCWAAMDELLTLVTSGSRGWGEYYADEGPSFIRAQDIKFDRLAAEVAHVSLPEGAEGLRTLVAMDDLLVTITGANVTKTARVDRDIGEAYVSQHVALCRLVLPALSEFLHRWLIAEECGRGQLLKSAYGGGKPGLNLNNIREVRVALPSLAEQGELASP